MQLAQSMGGLPLPPSPSPIPYGPYECRLPLAMRVPHSAYSHTPLTLTSHFHLPLAPHFSSISSPPIHLTLPPPPHPSLILLLLTPHLFSSFSPLTPPHTPSSTSPLTPLTLHSWATVLTVALITIDTIKKTSQFTTSFLIFSLRSEI